MKKLDPKIKNYIKENGIVDFEQVRKLQGKERKQMLGTIKKLLPIVEEPTAEELETFSIKNNREPYTEFPSRLPTYGKMPFPPDEHKHIGLYENKQNLYLLIAHAYNTIMERLDSLENP